MADNEISTDAIAPSFPENLSFTSEQQQFVSKLVAAARRQARAAAERSRLVDRLRAGVGEEAGPDLESAVADLVLAVMSVERARVQQLVMSMIEQCFAEIDRRLSTPTK